MSVWIQLNPAVIKHPEVYQVEFTTSYILMTNMSAKKRKEQSQNAKFTEMRKVIRSAAAAARIAYTEAERAQPTTPDVAQFLQVMRYCQVCLPGNVPGTYIR